MTFNFAEAKATVRRTVNTTFGVQAFYTDDSINTPVETRVRWHNRISRPYGDLAEGGYAEIVEGVDRIVFIPEDVDGYSFTTQRGGVFTIPELHPGVEFILDYKEPATGPLEEAWVVTRK